MEAANSGIKEESVEVALTEPDAAATVTVAVMNEVVVEKAGDAQEAPSGIKGERVEAAPTDHAAAATVEEVVADKVAVEKARDAPEGPSGIKEERTVDMAVVEEVALAPALVASVLMQEMELTQEQIVQQCNQEWVVGEYARQQSLPHSPSKDNDKIMKELEAILELIARETEEEQFKDTCMLAALTESETEATLD